MSSGDYINPWIPVTGTTTSPWNLPIKRTTSPPWTSNPTDYGVIGTSGSVSQPIILPCPDAPDHDWVEMTMAYDRVGLLQRVFRCQKCGVLVGIPDKATKEKSHKLPESEIVRVLPKDGYSEDGVSIVNQSDKAVLIGDEEFIQLAVALAVKRELEGIISTVKEWQETESTAVKLSSNAITIITSIVEKRLKEKPHTFLAQLLKDADYEAEAILRVMGAFGGDDEPA